MRRPLVESKSRSNAENLQAWGSVLVEKKRGKINQSIRMTIFFVAFHEQIHASKYICTYICIKNFSFILYVSGHNYTQLWEELPIIGDQGDLRAHIEEQ